MYRVPLRRCVLALRRAYLEVVANGRMTLDDFPGSLGTDRTDRPTDVIVCWVAPVGDQRAPARAQRLEESIATCRVHTPSGELFAIQSLRPVCTVQSRGYSHQNSREVTVR
jgi:hypothetical protein